jgi:acyl carrier protein
LLFQEKLIDSLNVLHLIGYLEKKLNRRLADEDLVMSNFRSVRAMAEAFFKEF